MSDIRYFNNSINADIYVGQWAGTKLLGDIENAKKSIKIVSPFLGPFYIEKLIGLAQKGVQVLLITSDEIEEHRDFTRPKIIYQLIKQIKKVDEKAQKLRNLLIKIRNVTIVLFVLSACLNIYFLLNQIFIISIFGLTLTLVLAAVIIIAIINDKRIYNYSYEQLFPFKVFLSPFKSKTRFDSNFYIHSKIYVIDDEIAYLGSLNFTNSGLKNNLESRIRITDSETVKGLSMLVDDLFNSGENSFIDIKSWGKKIYKEPIN